MTPSAEALAEVAGRLAGLAEAAPAEEVCGLVEQRPDGALLVRPLRNAAAHPGSGFLLAPEDVLDALRRHDLEERPGAAGGVRLVAVFHSHPSGGADLSALDLAVALCDGEPVLPGVAQVVVALSAGRAECVRWHRWDGGRYRAVDLWRRPRP